MKENNIFFDKLKIQLAETTSFPSDYLFKFIVPTTENQVAEVEKIFDNSGAIIKTKKSKTGKYTSVSIVLRVENASKIIDYYQEAVKIKGIISL